MNNAEIPGSDNNFYNGGRIYIASEEN